MGLTHWLSPPAQDARAGRSTDGPASSHSLLARGARLLASGILAWPLAVLAAMVVLFINESSHSRATQALQQLRERAADSEQIQTVYRRLLDAETGLRGYLLTGRKVYLEPYVAAELDVFQRLGRLRGPAAVDPVSAALEGRLREQLRLRFDELARMVAAFDSGQREVWMAALDDSAGRQRMQVLHDLCDQWLARERQLVGVDRQALLNTLSTSRIGVNATLVVGVLALLLVLRQGAALEASQRRHTTRLQEERQRLEAEARCRTADLTELARHLQTVREDECSRLARQLSDELGAVFTTARFDVARLRRCLAGRPEIIARLDHLDSSLGAGIALKRRLVEDLRPSSLANLGLITALQILLREFAERSGVRVQESLQELPLSEAAQTTFYRLVQEALTNIAKYAQANRVSVTLRRRGEMAELSVRDDGCGFDVSLRRPSTHGLMGMRYRAEAVGGTLRVESAPGRGTLLLAQLPLSLPEVPRLG